MRTLRLVGTDITTTAVGFGCASLFRLPRAVDRRLVLESAYDAGIRHFDVAPIYGLGLAEAELAAFLSRRRDRCTVTTKFGIDVTRLGKTAGRIQRPVRTALRRSQTLRAELKQSGQNPTAGWVGKLLYSSNGYTSNSAELSLDRSLKALETDYIDVFLLHDPSGDISGQSQDLVDFLDSQINAGKIRSWGVATDTRKQSGPVSILAQQGKVVQLRDDILEDLPTTEEKWRNARITFGIMERSLLTICRYLDESSEEGLKFWGDQFGFDLTNGRSLPDLLLRTALRRNDTGPVLFSSTRVDRVFAAAEQAIANQSSPLMQHEAEVLSALVAAVKNSDPQWSGIDH